MQSLGPNTNRHLAVCPPELVEGRFDRLSRACRPAGSAAHLFGIAISIQQVVQIGALVQLQLK
jgi:hypothetical protein